MLRIFTFLRNAFEPPSEKERRLLHAHQQNDNKTPQPDGTGEDSDELKKPSEPDSDRDDRTKLQRNAFHEKELNIMNGETEPQEEEPTGPATGGGGAGEPPEIDEGEEAREPEAPRIRIKAEALVEKANSALETIAKIKAILGNKEFMNKVREAAKRDTKIQDLLRSFEEDATVCDDAEKTIKDLKSEAEQFVLWQHPTERKLSPNEFAAANVRSRCIVLKPNSPEEKESERQIQRDVHDYLNDSAVMDKMDSDEHWNALNVNEKTPMIDHIEELTHIDETLEKMDETLTGYDTGLKVYLKQIQRLKDDMEKGGEISPPQQEWGGGSFTLKLIHFVYLAMAVKKIYDTWKKQWEYDFERAVGDCAAAISPWVAPTEVTQRLTEEMDANIEKVKKGKKELYSHIPFKDLHAAILTPNPDPAVKMAQLEVAAEKGWLYDIQEAGTATTVFGKQLATFLPSYWTNAQKEEFLQDIVVRNAQAQEKREATGVAAATQMGPPPGREGSKGQAWFIIPHIREALEKHDYHYARGLIKKAINKGDLGNSPTWAAVAIIKTLQQYPEATKFLGEDIIKQFGNLVLDPQTRAAQGFLLSTFKFLAGDYVALAGKGSGAHLTLPGKAQAIGEAITRAEQLIHANGGRIQFESTELKAGIDCLSEEEQLEYAVAKILAGDAVRVGTAAISLYNNVEEFHRYRDIVADTSYKEKLNFENMDSDYANTINEYLLHDRTKIAPALYAGTDGRLPRASFVNGQFVQIGELAKKLQGEPTAYATFIAEQKKRWKEPLIQFLQHRTPKIAEMRDGIPLMFELGIISTNDLHIGQGEEQVRPQTARELNAFLQEAGSRITITIPTANNPPL